MLQNKGFYILSIVQSHRPLYDSYLYNTFIASNKSYKGIVKAKWSNSEPTFFYNGDGVADNYAEVVFPEPEIKVGTVEIIVDSAVKTITITFDGIGANTDFGWKYNDTEPFNAAATDDGGTAVAANSTLTATKLYIPTKTPSLIFTLADGKVEVNYTEGYHIPSGVQNYLYYTEDKAQIAGYSGYIKNLMVN